MKKCDYCGKEISYMEQYCDENCHRKALDFYQLQEKFSKLFSLVNIICVFGIPIGIFISTFAGAIGFTLLSFSVAVEGLIILILPFPVENMITSMKIKKAVNVTRLIGAGFLILGIVLIILDFIFYL